MLQESYNQFLLEKIQELFKKDELEAYLEANEKQRPTVLRVNTLLKRRKDVIQALHSRQVETGVLDWTDSAIVAYKSEVPLGATPEYLAGFYFIQGAASMLPVLNLDIQENQIVVDLCAAPGGKSTHIAELMNNTGILYCNEINLQRTKSLRANISRMGITNSVITNFDAKDFNIGKKVDRVLLDAPCSGTGVISKDPTIKTSKSAAEIKKIVKEQKELILHAFDMLKVNGIMVYSTCSVLTDENENVVDYLLSKRPHAKIMEPTVNVGVNGFVSFYGESFHGTLKNSKRLYPHVHNMDGFFYCKIRKASQ